MQINSNYSMMVCRMKLDVSRIISLNLVQNVLFRKMKI